MVDSVGADCSVVALSDGFTAFCVVHSDAVEEELAD